MSKSAAIYWAVIEPYSKWPPEKIRELLTQVIKLVTNTGYIVQPDHALACFSSRQASSSEVRKVIQTCGFSEIFADSDITPSDLLTRKLAKGIGDPTFPGLVVFLTARRWAQDLPSTVYSVRKIRWPQVWVVDTQNRQYHTFSTSVHRFVALERLVKNDALAKKKKRGAAPDGLSPVAIYWDLDNCVDLRQSAEQIHREVVTIVDNLFRYLLARRLFPARRLLHVAAQIFPTAVAATLREKGFRLHQVGGKRDAADNRLLSCACGAVQHRLVSFPEDVVVLSGDGRLSLLVKFLKERERKVKVMCWQASRSRTLAYVADEVVDLGDLIRPKS